MKLILPITLLLTIYSSFLFGFEPQFAIDPAISPDGSKICISYKGDLWLVPFEGGLAKRITSTEANEYNPCFSPQGDKIAFTANREGQNWIYVMPSAGGLAKPIIREGYTVCDWFADGLHLLCSKTNLGYGTSLYKLPLDGSRAVMIAEIGDVFCSLSPDNNKIIFNRYGDPHREAYQGSANGDLWEYDIKEKTYTRLTQTNFTERYPVFSHASNSIFYCASDGKNFQLFRCENRDFANSYKLSDFSTWSARDISVARQNDRIVFELFNEIWRFDSTKLFGDRISKVDIEIQEDNWSNPVTTDTIFDTIDDFAVSDHELLVAFKYKYDLFVMPRKGGEVRQITSTHSGIEDIGFLSDNRTILYTRFADGINNLFTVKVDTLLTINQVDWLGKNKYNVDNIYKSESKNWIIEYTDSLGSGRIAVADTSLQNIRLILQDKLCSSNFALSPDGSMAVYASNRNDIGIRELFMVNLADNTHKKIMNDDAWITSITWLPDQSGILMTRYGDIWRLDFKNRDEFSLDTDHWKEILSKTSGLAGVTDSLKTDKTKSPSRKSINQKPKILLSSQEIDWFQIDKRIFRIVSSDANLYPVKAIDDTSFYFLEYPSAGDSKAVLKKANLMGKHISEISTFPREFSNYQFVSDNSLYYISSGKLKNMNLKSKTRADISYQYKYSYNQKELNAKVFEQVWGVFGRRFYDATMHNTDWAELYTRYKKYLQYADTPSILGAIIDEMIGEVNASHTGYSPRSERSTVNKPIAQLGLEFEQRNPMPRGMKINRIYRNSVLYNLYGIRSGAVLLEIDGVKLTDKVPLDSLLMDKVDKKIKLSFSQDNKLIPATIKGLSWSANRELWYQERLERRKSEVNTLSQNRIGYVQIPRMGKTDYDNFVRDLFRDNADKEALIIDVRGNSGGRIHDDLIGFLTKKPNTLTSDRMYGSVKRESPRRTWTKPIALLIDENSYSDSEIFPFIFREMKLGTVIGMPTSGAVIGTWDWTLMDGSTMRLPVSGWFSLQGENLEGMGAAPDIRVEMHLNDIVSENDVQLKKAVDVLLEQLNK